MDFMMASSLLPEVDVTAWPFCVTYPPFFWAEHRIQVAKVNRKRFDLHRKDYAVARLSQLYALLMAPA
jgi:hypothetical protein